MVGFKEWSDYNKFMQKYAKCCCQNCTGWIGEDMNKGQFVCMRVISPVRLNMTTVCVEWQGENGESLDDVDREFPFKFSKDVWDKLTEIEEDLSFEEIKEIIENEEYKK